MAGSIVAACLLAHAASAAPAGVPTAPTCRELERRLDLIKPDAEAYRVVATGLGIDLVDMVFIDNKATNVDGATAIGVTGHVFTSPAELRSFLVGLAA